MLTHDYSFDTCLKGSVTQAWTVEDCFRGRDFDFDKPFLPDRIAGAVDGLLAQQIELDIDALQQASRRTFTDDERDAIRVDQRRAYRWTFLVSGLQHPNFVRIVEQVTTSGATKIATAARALAA